jgi:hypothetical protein
MEIRELKSRDTISVVYCAHLSANSSADQLMDHLHTGVDYNRNIFPTFSVHIPHTECSYVQYVIIYCT